MRTGVLLHARLGVVVGGHGVFAGWAPIGSPTSLPREMRLESANCVAG
jgi:hypothetical protein